MDRALILDTQREVARQGEALREVMQLEVPALRLELQLLRADLQNLEEYFESANSRLAGDRFVMPPRGRKPDAGPRSAVVPLERRAVKGKEEATGLWSWLSGAEEPGVEDNLLATEDDPFRRPEARVFNYYEDSPSSTMAERYVEKGLEASAWDSGLLVALHGATTGAAHVGYFNVLLAWALLFLNIILQALFVVTLASLADGGPVTDMKGVLQNQRLLNGQAYENMDRETMRTRTKQTCALRSYDRLGTTVEWASSYLQEGDAGGVLPGYVIAFLAMLVWILDVAKELRDVAELLFVVLALPSTSELAVEGSRFSVRHVVVGATRVQKFVCIFFVLLPRLVIAVCLLNYGLLYLASTIDVNDILLNAVALEFVKQVDEMLFVAVVPPRLVEFCAGVTIRAGDLDYETLDLTGLVRGSGFSQLVSRLIEQMAQPVYALVRVSFIVLMLILSVWRVAPVVYAIRSVYKDVCGYDTDFIYTTHPQTGLPVFANIDESDRLGSMDEMKCYYAASYDMLRIRAGFEPRYSEHNSTIEALIRGTDPMCSAPPFVDPQMDCPDRREGLQYFSQIAVTSIKNYRRSYDCRDQEVAFAVLRSTCLNETFRSKNPLALSFFEKAADCKSLRKYCAWQREFRDFSYNMTLPWLWRVQKVCPHSCGFCHHRDLWNASAFVSHTVEEEDV